MNALERTICDKICAGLLGRDDEHYVRNNLPALIRQAAQLAREDERRKTKEQAASQVEKWLDMGSSEKYELPRLAARIRAL